MGFFSDIHRIMLALESIAVSLKAIADAATGKVTGIVIDPDKPTTH